MTVLYEVCLKPIMSSLSLQFGIIFPELQTPQGLARVQKAFCQFLEERDGELFNLYINRLRHAHEPLIEDSSLFLCLAPFVEDFLGALFGITAQVHHLQQQHADLAPLFTCKRLFLQRRVARQIPSLLNNAPKGEVLRKTLEVFFQAPYTDLIYARQILLWLEEPDSYEKELAIAAQYGAWALETPEGRLYHRDSALFHLPQKQDFRALIPDLIETHDRHGFSLTDPGLTQAQALDQARYCLVCHDRQKDSCAQGFGGQKNPLDRLLDGCPLDQKISEMNALKQQGLCLGALAVITIDNPLVAATGHRICNDCKASCIFQTQEPVDIPGVETQILQDVLALPWGFEIYALLTRWNPLKFDKPSPKAHQGGRVLVVGMGPAGFTLAHYLLQEGHTVVGVEGLKVEPLPPGLLHHPVKDCHDLMISLEKRIVGGFGGVAEYGITARWNKNYLTLTRILLERQEHFLLEGGVRFGSTMTPQQAFDTLGFDHVALCTGAGKPALIPLKNGLARGVRVASDFLMALQLTGAAQETSLANLDVRLPALVLGGGLTALDTATEVLAYYPVQVEKFLKRYEALGSDIEAFQFDPEEKVVALEWVDHAKALRQERLKAQPNVLSLLNAWGGVTVLYRKTLQESPGYRLNHEEVFKALQEGIHFAGEVEPLEVLVDEKGHINSLEVFAQGVRKTFPARALLIAAGTSPNVTLATEYPDIFSVQKGTYQPAKNYSFLGDLHPSYKGSVVKAMASAKAAYPEISAQLKSRSKEASKDFLKNVQDQLRATVQAVNRLTPTIVEVIVKAPLAVKNFKPGQFYRLQNFETYAPQILGTTLALEGIAVTGAYVDLENDCVSLIVLEMGGSSSLCPLLKPGDPIVLMGPTGTPTTIPQNQEKICLVGGGLGNAVLLSIGTALKEAGHEVVYVAGYRTPADIFYPQRIEAAAHEVIWMCETGFVAGKTSFQGTVIDGLKHLDLSSFDRFMVIGSSTMMVAVGGFLQGQPLKENVTLMASINSPMQCMMKEICGQCLQRQVDPKSGQETYVYSCVTQDQDMTCVDFSHLQARLKQNSVSEKMTSLWIEKCHISLKNE